MRDFRKYDIWIDSMALVNEIYDVLDGFPDNEKYGLRSQISRCAVSIPSNIAEGCGRKSTVEFARFLEFSLGSAYELETQMIISKERAFVSKELHKQLEEKIQSLQKRISGLMHSMR